MMDSLSLSLPPPHPTPPHTHTDLLTNCFQHQWLCFFPAEVLLVGHEVCCSSTQIVGLPLHEVQMVLSLWIYKGQ